MKNQLELQKQRLFPFKCANTQENKMKQKIESHLSTTNIKSSVNILQPYLLQLM